MKTTRMLLIEAVSGYEIEDVILSVVRAERGELNLAATRLQVDGGTLNRWIDRLGLRERVNEIRLACGLRLTGIGREYTRGVETEPVPTDALVFGPCQLCGSEVDEHEGVLVERTDKAMLLREWNDKEGKVSSHVFVLL